MQEIEKICFLVGAQRLTAAFDLHSRRRRLSSGWRRSHRWSRAKKSAPVTPPRQPAFGAQPRHPARCVGRCGGGAGAASFGRAVMGLPAGALHRQRRYHLCRWQHSCRHGAAGALRLSLHLPARVEPAQPPYDRRRNEHRRPQPQRKENRERRHLQSCRSSRCSPSKKAASQICQMSHQLESSTDSCANHPVDAPSRPPIKVGVNLLLWGERPRCCGGCGGIGRECRPLLALQLEIERSHVWRSSPLV